MPIQKDKRLKDFIKYINEQDRYTKMVCITNNRGNANSKEGTLH